VIGGGRTVRKAANVVVVSHWAWEMPSAGRWPGHVVPPGSIWAPGGAPPRVKRRSWLQRARLARFPEALPKV
jgi:hypothetical protein